MKAKYALLAAAVLLSSAHAALPENTLAGVPAVSAERVSGYINLGYSTNYTGRGYVITHSVAEGDSSENAALHITYDVGAKSLWTFESTVAYTAVSSGHTLYGNPMATDAAVVAGVMDKMGVDAQKAAAIAAKKGMFGTTPVKQANIENEFAVVTAAKYTREKWNVTIGHDFIHGGLLGVMAKHYRDQGASCVNEVFITPMWTPTKWFELGVTTRYSFQGITGWWFEPEMSFKLPVVGPQEAPKMAAKLTLGMTATADYFQSRYFACKNGSQSFWVKLATPIFMNEDRNFILTPAVSFNWAGKGAMKANEKSEFKRASGNPSNTPFRNFGVVGSVSCTYVF